MTIETARAAYRRLRASTATITAAEFDRIAGRIAHELADGEEITPRDWLQAAEMVASGGR